MSTEQETPSAHATEDPDDEWKSNPHDDNGWGNLIFPEDQPILHDEEENERYAELG